MEITLGNALALALLAAALSGRFDITARDPRRRQRAAEPWVYYLDRRRRLDALGAALLAVSGALFTAECARALAAGVPAPAHALAYLLAAAIALTLALLVALRACHLGARPASRRRA